MLSFDRDGTEKFIEVKTTKQGKHWPMLISRNERVLTDASVEDVGVTVGGDVVGA